MKFKKSQCPQCKSYYFDGKYHRCGNKKLVGVGIYKCSYWEQRLEV